MRYHRCALTSIFSTLCTTLHSTFLASYQSLQRLEAGWSVFQKESLSISCCPFLGRDVQVNRERKGPVGSRKTSVLSLPWCCPQSWQPAQQQLCRPLPSYTSVALSVSSLLEPKEKLCIILRFSSLKTTYLANSPTLA